MLMKTSEARGSGRAVRRWFGVIATAAVFALGASACSADTAALTNKNEGDATDSPTVIEQVDDPVIEGDLIAAKEVDGGDGSGLLPDHVVTAAEDAEDDLDDVPIVVVEGDGEPEAAPAPEAEDIVKLREAMQDMPKGFVTPKMDMDIETAVPLQRIAWSQTRDAEGCSTYDRPFYTMAAGEKGGYCFRVHGGDPDAWVDVQYRIGDTKEVLHIKARVPLMGDNVVSCDIVNNGDGKPVLNSKYVCEKSWQNTDDPDGYGHGNNPKPRIVLKQKPEVVVADIAQAQQLVKDNCIKNKSACDYSTAVQDVRELPEDEAYLYGSPHTNCSTQKEEEHSFSDSVTIGWSDSIGGSANVQVTFLKDVIKGSLEASYEHVITEERTFKNAVNGWVEYGKTHAFYVVPGVVHVEGDVRVTKPDKIYVIKDQQFDIPLAKNWNPNGGRGQAVSAVRSISRSFDTKCKDGKPVEKLIFPDRGFPTTPSGRTVEPVDTSNDD